MILLLLLSITLCLRGSQYFSLFTKWEKYTLNTEQLDQCGTVHKYSKRQLKTSFGVMTVC